MEKSVTEQRQLENEAVFRKANEQTTESVKELKEIAKEDDQLSLIHDEDMKLHFFCECSDEDCQDRIVITTSRYEALHKDRKQFILKPGHDVKQIEEVVFKNPNYHVVKKNRKPPEQVEKLQQTSS